MLTQQRLKEVLYYDPVVGEFRWRKTLGSRAKAGYVAGGPHARGIPAIRVDKKLYYSHILAWVYMTGEWPLDEIDHKNLDQHDYRFANLRAANAHQQRGNTKKRPMRREKRPTSERKGVCRHHTGRWAAYIKRDGKTKYLGLFDTERAAHAAYMKAAEMIFGEFARAA